MKSAISLLQTTVLPYTVHQQFRHRSRSVRLSSCEAKIVAVLPWHIDHCQYERHYYAHARQAPRNHLANARSGARPPGRRTTSPLQRRWHVRTRTSLARIKVAPPWSINKKSIAIVSRGHTQKVLIKPSLRKKRAYMLICYSCCLIILVANASLFCLRVVITWMKKWKKWFSACSSSMLDCTWNIKTLKH